MLVNDCKGGESMIVDGYSVLYDLKEEHPNFLKFYVISPYLLENLMKTMRLMLLNQSLD